MRSSDLLIRSWVVAAMTAGCALIAGGLVPTGASAAPRTASASSATINGTFEHEVVDGRGNNADLERDVVVAGNKSYAVKLPKGAKARAGDAVTMSGILSGATF